MLAYTDIAVIIVLLILASNGAYQGFLRSLIGPLSLALSIAVAALVYFSTKNYSTSFLVTIIGPFFFSWAILIMFKKIVNPDEAPRLSTLSRVGGQLVNLAWGSVLMGCVVIFLSLFPFDRYQLPGATADVKRSYSYRIVYPIFTGAPLRTVTENPSDCLTGLCSAKPEDVQALASDKEVQDVMNDPRVQMINDPAIQKAVAEKNIASLITNPVIMELSQDPAFLAKVLKVYPKIQQATHPAPAASPEKDKETAPVSSSPEGN